MNAGAGSSLHRIGGTPRDGSLADGYAVRPAAPDDIEAVAELVGAYDTVDFGRPDELGLEFLREGWPQTQGERTGAWIVLRSNGDCAGFAVTSMEAGRDSVVEALGRAHPRDANKGIGAALLDLTEAHARARPSQRPADVRLRHDVSGSDSAARKLLRHAGYDHVRRFLHMEIDVSGAVPPASVHGITIRRARLPAEERVIHALNEAAFGDDWDFVPSSFAGWVLGSTRSPESDPSLWFVALADDVIVGFLWARVRGTFGYVNDIAVAEDARGRGIGGALLRHSFAEFRRRGFTKVMLNVDADNPTGAPRLYRNAGMRIRRGWDVYEKVLGP